MTFYVHIIMYLKLQLLPATSANCPVVICHPGLPVGPYVMQFIKLHNIPVGLDDR